MGLDDVEIFYSHRFHPDIRLRRQRAPWTQPCARARRCTRASRPIRRRRRERRTTASPRSGTSLLIHQPSYSLLIRWIEPELLDTLGELGVGCICFSPLAQGLLTAKYLDGIPADSRAARDGSLSPELLTDETLGKIRALNQVAARRGQSLAQLALAWTLRDPRMTSTLVLSERAHELSRSRWQRRRNPPWPPGPDQCRRHSRVAQRPGKRELRQRLPRAGRRPGSGRPSSRASRRSAARVRASRRAAARESAGMPSRYFAVSNPCASGESRCTRRRARRACRAAPARSSGSGASTTGLNQERRPERGEAVVRLSRLSATNRTRCPRTAPCPSAPACVQGARCLPQRSVGSNRC